MASRSSSTSMAATIQYAEDLATSSSLERQNPLEIAFASHRLNLVCKVFRTLTAVRRSGWQRILKAGVMIKNSPAAQGALYTEGATPPGVPMRMRSRPQTSLSNMKKRRLMIFQYIMSEFEEPLECKNQKLSVAKKNAGLDPCGGKSFCPPGNCILC